MDLGASNRRVAELVAWSVVAVGGAVILSQALQWDGLRPLATLQSLTPYLLIPLGLVAGAALWWLQRPLLSLVAAVAGLGVVLLATPLVMPPDQPSPRSDAVGLRAASINLLYSNTRTEDVADDLLDRDLDLIVFSEYTAEHERRLLAHELVDDYPHRIERAGSLADGIAIWSRYPIDGGVRADTINASIDSIVSSPDGDVRVLAIHAPTPIYDFAGWQEDLTRIGDLADRPGPPTLVIGDFNASYWHPSFRDLLERGLTDAHIANGHGWTTSWPTDELVPPFVRLDHALTGNDLVSTDVSDFRIPGSDHAGFVVTVAPAH